MKKFDFTKQLPTYCSSKHEKEYFLIFSIMVAGKNAKATAQKTWDLLQWAWEKTPFEYLKFLIKSGKLEARLVSSKTGMYKKLISAFEDVVKLNVETCTLNDLLNCHGIGNKTARFFLLNTRKDAEYAALDTHILKWLNSLFGHSTTVPKSTPASDSQYAFWESKAITEMRKQYPSKSLAQADFEIWKQYAKG